MATALPPCYEFSVEPPHPDFPTFRTLCYTANQADVIADNLQLQVNEVAGPGHHSITFKRIYSSEEMARVQQGSESRSDEECEEETDSD